MSSDIQEIYTTAIEPLPDSEKLKLASLILDKVSQRSSATDELEQPPRTGDSTRFFGMFNSGDPDSADNERIDADLARAYADDHEDED